LKKAPIQGRKNRNVPRSREKTSEVLNRKKQPSAETTILGEEPPLVPKTENRRPRRAGSFGRGSGEEKERSLERKRRRVKKVHVNRKHEVGIGSGEKIWTESGKDETQIRTSMAKCGYTAQAKGSRSQIQFIMATRVGSK